MAWWIDLAWLRAALPPPAARVWYYGLKRATAATMGSLMWRGFAAWVSFALPLLGLLAIMGLFAWASGWAMYYAYAVLDVQ